MTHTWKILASSSAVFVAFTLSLSPMASDDAPSAPSGDTETATFAMYCYWTGEATVGRVDGVVASRIGHWGGEEIVQVDFDPAQTSVEELARALRKQRSLYHVVQSRSAAKPISGVDGDAVKLKDGTPHFIEPKHSLRTRYPKLHALDLTEAQAIALNSWSYFGGAMPDVLTAEQKQRVGL